MRSAAARVKRLDQPVFAGLKFENKYEINQINSWCRHQRTDHQINQVCFKPFINQLSSASHTCNLLIGHQGDSGQLGLPGLPGKKVR